MGNIELAICLFFIPFGFHADLITVDLIYAAILRLVAVIVIGLFFLICQFSCLGIENKIDQHTALFVAVKRRSTGNDLAVLIAYSFDISVIGKLRRKVKSIKGLLCLPVYYGNHIDRIVIGIKRFPVHIVACRHLIVTGRIDDHVILINARNALGNIFGLFV